MTDFAANLAFFLLGHTGSIFGTWSGTMNAKKQNKILGCYLGRGTIVINGDNETIMYCVGGKVVSEYKFSEF